MKDVFEKAVLMALKIMAFLPTVFFVILPAMVIDGEKGADMMNNYWIVW